MQKVILTHIGAVSLGKMMAIWSFVLGLIFLLIYGLMMVVLAIIGMASGTDAVQTLGALAIFLVLAVIGLFVYALVMFILGLIAATIYNVILGISGGLDMDFKEKPAAPHVSAEAR